MADGIEEAKAVAGTDNQEVIMEEKALYTQARLATEAEHSLGAWKAFKMYKKAALWSICRHHPMLVLHPHVQC